VTYDRNCTAMLMRFGLVLNCYIYADFCFGFRTKWVCTGFIKPVANHIKANLFVFMLFVVFVL